MSYLSRPDSHILNKSQNLFEIMVSVLHSLLASMQIALCRRLVQTLLCLWGRCPEFPPPPSAHCSCIRVSGQLFGKQSSRVLESECLLGFPAGTSSDVSTSQGQNPSCCALWGTFSSRGTKPLLSLEFKWRRQIPGPRIFLNLYQS